MKKEERDIPNELKGMVDEFLSHISVRIVMYCPYCEEKVSGSMPITQSPREGDSTICPYCFNLLQFDEKLGLIQFTSEAWQVLGEKKQRELKKIRQEVIEGEEDGQT